MNRPLLDLSASPQVIRAPCCQIRGLDARRTAKSRVYVKTIPGLVAVFFPADEADEEFAANAELALGMGLIVDFDKNGYHIIRKTGFKLVFHILGHSGPLFLKTGFVSYTGFYRLPASLAVTFGKR